MDVFLQLFCGGPHSLRGFGGGGSGLNGLPSVLAIAPETRVANSLIRDR